MKTPNTIDSTWKGSICFPETGADAGVVQKGVGRGRREVLLLIVPVCVRVSVRVIVVGAVVVDTSVVVTVVVVVMKEVSKTETVFSTVLVW